MAMLSQTAVFAGGLLTNTNQSFIFGRNFARDGVIAIDGVYSNPAGVAFLGKGLHLSLGGQSASQTRTIRSGMTLLKPAGLPMTDEQWMQSPYAHPLSLNGGDANGIKSFKGEASAPFVPSVQAALNYDKWGFQFAFGLVGGGGKCTFNRGLGSFERQVALLPSILQLANTTYQQQYGIDLGLGSNTPGYSVESYIHGQQYVFGFQFGSTYKVNENLAVYGGFRFNYIYNKYEGSISNITVNITGQTRISIATSAPRRTPWPIRRSPIRSRPATTPAWHRKQRSLATSRPHSSMPPLPSNSRRVRNWHRVARRPLVACGARWPTATSTARSADGASRQSSVLTTAGANSTSARAGVHNTSQHRERHEGGRHGPLRRWCEHAQRYPGHPHRGWLLRDTADLACDGELPLLLRQGRPHGQGQAKLLSSNTWEWALGSEYDISDALTVSAGMQRTKYGLGDGSYLTDMSFTTSSYSYGFGAKVRVAPKVTVEASYFWTNYETFDKEYDQQYSAAGMSATAHNTDQFTRTNKVFGVGVNLDF